MSIRNQIFQTALDKTWIHPLISLDPPLIIPIFGQKCRNSQNICPLMTGTSGHTFFKAICFYPSVITIANLENARISSSDFRGSNPLISSFNTKEHPQGVFFFITVDYRGLRVSAEQVCRPAHTSEPPIRMHRFSKTIESPHLSIHTFNPFRLDFPIHTSKSML